MTKILFYPEDDWVKETFPYPEPIKKSLPDWYKNMSKNIVSYPGPHFQGMGNLTLKKCLPAFDIMSSGYVIKAPCDIQFSENPRISWNPNKREIISDNHTLDQIVGFKIPEEYERKIYKWINGWIIKTPPGYSSIILHPMYRTDLPFYIFGGIVDTDKHDTPINFPFLLEKKFDGVVRKGTPIAQIIPIKRQNWKMKVESVQNFSKFSLQNLHSYLENGYRKMSWAPKSYN